MDLDMPGCCVPELMSEMCFMESVCAHAPAPSSLRWWMLCSTCSRAWRLCSRSRRSTMRTHSLKVIRRAAHWMCWWALGKLSAIPMMVSREMVCTWLGLGLGLGVPLLSRHFLRHLSSSGPEATAWPYG